MSPGVPILQIRDLRFGYENREVLMGLDLEVDVADVLAVVGPSGGGKTTLLKTVNLLLFPTSGSISYHGEKVFEACPRRKIGGFRSWALSLLGLNHGSLYPVQPPSLHGYRRQFGMVFQEFNLWPSYTLRENISAPLVWQKQREAVAVDERVQECARVVQIEGLLERYPGEVSGGQRQRAAIARALSVNPSILLLDEITSALDPELVGDILDVIESLAESGMTMILVTHHLEFARRVANRVAYLSDGRLLGPYSSSDFFCQSDAEIARFVRHLRRV